jgi:hypothetical protein
MKKIIYALLLFVTVSSCTEMIDGGVHSPYVNETTVDFLKANGKFDIVLTLFENAGLLDQLNEQNTTVFIPTDYSVKRYVKQIPDQLRFEQYDENLEFTLSDLLDSTSLYQDSLKMYIVNERIGREDLTSEIYTESLLGNEVEISLQASEKYTDLLPNSVPQLLFYKWVKNGLDPDNTNEVARVDRDKVNICQTSGIITTTGVLHVLEDKHDLFYNERTPNFYY